MSEGWDDGMTYPYGGGGGGFIRIVTTLRLLPGMGAETVLSVWFEREGDDHVFLM